MTYLDKYYEFRAELIRELNEQLLTKEYDKTDVWEDENERFNLPTQYYLEDFGYELYPIVKYDMDGFKGIGRESEEEYWFEIDELDTEIIAHILDILNDELDKQTLDTKSEST